jgi:hypothetical protein
MVLRILARMPSRSLVLHAPAALTPAVVVA